MNANRVLEHLAQLVACDTQNPPRRIDGDSGIFSYCTQAVGSGFNVDVRDHGDGYVSWFAVRGQPSVLFNVHIDTVPVGEGWTHDPLALTVTDGRAFGRGACDIKGAAAVLLSIAESAPPNLALLFTSDEEGAGGCCVERFLESGAADRFRQVIVAEPTRCRPVLSHRGYLSVKMWVHGRPGHSSEARALNDNAIHQAACWAARAVEAAEARKASPEDPGACFNIGLMDAPGKSNVIAGKAFLHWSARLPPGESNQAFMNEIKALVPEGAMVDWDVPFAGRPLPAAGQDSDRSMAYCREAGLDPAAPVDFWTEAALFSAAGLPALVLGPGDIAQAHQIDEWVSLHQLDEAGKIYGDLVKADE